MLGAPARPSRRAARPGTPPPRCSPGRRARAGSRARVRPPRAGSGMPAPRRGRAWAGRRRDPRPPAPRRRRSRTRSRGTSAHRSHRASMLAMRRRLSARVSGASISNQRVRPPPKRSGRPSYPPPSEHDLVDAAPDGGGELGVDEARVRNAIAAERAAGAGIQPATPRRGGARPPRRPWAWRVGPARAGAAARRPNAHRPRGSARAPASAGHDEAECLGGGDTRP